MENIILKKTELFDIITNFYNDYEINNTYLQLIIDKHKNYMYLMNNINISIIYIWIELKDDYKKIKSNINKNNKLYQNIIKLYSNIIVYFNIDESKNIKKKIHDINIKKINNIMALRELSVIHKNICINHYSLTNNKNFMTITQYSLELNNIINELISNTKKLNKARNDIKLLIKLIIK